MSSQSLVVSSFWNDVLADTKFKPWFESWKGYIVALLFASSFFVIYTIKPEDYVFCYREGNISFTREELLYAKSVCAFEIKSADFYFGWFMLGFCIIIHLLNSWWLMNPTVCRLFRSLRDSDNKYNDFHLSLKKVRLGVFSSLSGKRLPADLLKEEEAKVIDSVTTNLKSFNENSFWSWDRIYIITSYIYLLLMYSINVLGVLTYPEEPQSFPCNVYLSSPVNASCTHHLDRKLHVIVVANAVIYLVFTIAFTVPTFMLTLYQVKIIINEKRPYRNADFDFAIWFGNKSQPIDERTRLTIEILNFHRDITKRDCPEEMLEEFLDLIFHPGKHEECFYMTFIPKKPGTGMREGTVDHDLSQEKNYLKKTVGEIFNYKFETQNDENWNPPEYLERYIENVKEIRKSLGKVEGKTQHRSIDV